jgi:hypothetical protein
VIRVIRETHDTPRFAEHALRLAGGTNRFGESNYRAVWGWNRLTWIGGKWTDWDASGRIVRESVELRRVPKYIPHDRWHIERWLPPESYGSPATWYAQTTETENGIRVPALGPYPHRGEYEHCLTLEGPQGEFLQLTPTAVERIALLIERARAARSAERHAALTKREARAENDYDAWAYDVLDDAVPALHGQPFLTVP